MTFELGFIPSVSGGGGATGSPAFGARIAPDSVTGTGFLILGNGLSADFALVERVLRVPLLRALSSSESDDWSARGSSDFKKSKSESASSALYLSGAICILFIGYRRPCESKQVC